MMEFFTVYLQALLLITGLMTLLWIISTAVRNVSIVDLFWGAGFVVTGVFYYLTAGGTGIRREIVLILLLIWGLRLSLYLTIRNLGKPEDFRYQEFRRKYGEKRYWWISYFQTFLLQGVLMWLISAPLLAVMAAAGGKYPETLDYIALLLWLTGFIFEAGGDVQMSRFRADPGNRGTVLDTGFWKYTRHPNYFGDAAVWWAFGLFALASGYVLPLAGSLLMTLLLLKVSGVALLEKSLKAEKPAYRDYMERTSAFIPWFPAKRR